MVTSRCLSYIFRCLDNWCHISHNQVKLYLWVALTATVTHVLSVHIYIYLFSFCLSFYLISILDIVSSLSRNYSDHMDDRPDTLNYIFSSFIINLRVDDITCKDSILMCTCVQFNINISRVLIYRLLVEIFVLFSPIICDRLVALIDIISFKMLISVFSFISETFLWTASVVHNGSCSVISVYKHRM